MPANQLARRTPHIAHAAIAAELAAARDGALMQGIVAGCAIVAYADGWPTDDERARMVALLGDFIPNAAFTTREVLASFDEFTTRFADDYEAGDREALAFVGRLKGRERYPALLVETCCAIAAADGGFDAEEREAIARICTALDLDRADFDLADAR